MNESGENQFQDLSHETENFDNDFEVVPPTVDLLINHLTGNPLIPAELQANLEIKKQADLRKELLSQFDTVFDKIQVNVEFDDAFEQGSINDDELISLYQKLTKFLNDDPNNSRLILYLPFELIPTKKIREDSPLKHSQIEFVSSYLNSWHHLLTERDVRANFVDGDVLEPDFVADHPPYVCKAAHLVPELAKKGWLDVSKIAKFAEECEDDTLKQSLLETIPVLDDLKLINPDDSNRIRFLLPQNNDKVAETPATVSDPESLFAQFEAESKQIVEESEAKKLNDPKHSDRWNWEKSDKIDSLILKQAGSLASLIQKGSVKIDETMLKDDESQNMIVVEAIKKSIEDSAKENLEQAQAQIREAEGLLMTLWEKEPVKIKDRIVSALSHWEKLNIIDSSYTTKFGIDLPNLDSLTDKQMEVIKQDIEKFKPLLQKIQSDPQLREALYPAMIFFGSKIKGYSNPGADLDISIFIKPEFEFAQREALLEKLNQIFKENGQHCRPAEFWLEKNDESIKIKDVPLIDNAIADKDWIYVLMQGIWFGDSGSISEVGQKLISDYFNSLEAEHYPGINNREVWLREIEREVLQYRLMHKGYARYFPKQGGIQTEHSNLIDSKSDFWDPGFRRIATKLFLSKVFLPNIK